jgi:hypothetical protein
VLPIRVVAVRKPLSHTRDHQQIATESFICLLVCGGSLLGRLRALCRSTSRAGPASSYSAVQPDQASEPVTERGAALRTKKYAVEAGMCMADWPMIC